MVVFGDKVTKILCNSLFTFFTVQGKTGKMERKSCNQNDERTKNEVTKICNEPGIRPWKMYALIKAYLIDI